MQQRVRKAVFPVGGLGTRFLPATKAMPKEMLPVVDKPLIQYAVEEARAAGIEELIFVTGRGKSAIEDHFDHSVELENLLAARGKNRELEEIIRALPLPGRVAYLRQQEPLGLGHAVWCARSLIGDEPFAVLLADDLILAERPCIRQMIDAHSEVGGNVVAAMEVPSAQVSRYGILELARARGGKSGSSARVMRARGVVEKPMPEKAPSRLAVIGRYILDPRVLELLERQTAGAGGEIQLTDAIAATLGEVPLHGFRFEGQRFDCGDKLGFFEANLAFALARPDLGPAAMAVLRSYVPPLESEEPAAAAYAPPPQGELPALAFGD
jgi:UTP--glucose-1-phosphate uridylyltransferase